MKWFFSYVVIVLLLLIFDSIWLKVTKKFYQARIGSLLRSEFIVYVVVLFYLFYAAAVLYFCVMPSHGDWLHALLSGMFFGFTAYMTYELVNYATLRNWPLSVVLLDLSFGAFFTGFTAMIAAFLFNMSVFV